VEVERPVSRPVSAIVASFIAGSVCVASAATAQPAIRVLLAGQPALEPPALDALRSELATRGLRLEVLAGWSAREAETEGASRVGSGEASAVLWLEVGPWRGLALGPGGERRAALLPDAPGSLEPHVVAVLFASALDEALEPNDALTAASDAEEAEPPREAAVPPPPVLDDSAATLDPVPSAPRRGLAHAVLGVGGTFFAQDVLNDVRALGGLELRAGVLLTIDDLEVAVVGSFGYFLDERARIGAELQPLVGTCVEVGAPTEIDEEIRGHFGGRLCGGYLELRRDLTDRTGFSFAVDEPNVWTGLGAYTAVTLPMAPGWRWGAKLEMEARAVFLGENAGLVLAPTLSLLFVSD
jgi:hypothetical protein